MFTGDTVLGRGTTVVAHPDGHLGSYLASLRRLAELPEGTIALPGHGPELPDASAAAKAYLDHRQQRLNQVREVVRVNLEMEGYAVREAEAALVVAPARCRRGSGGHSHSRRERRSPPRLYRAQLPGL